MTYSLIVINPRLIHRQDFLILSCSINKRDGKNVHYLETHFVFFH